MITVKEFNWPLLIVDDEDIILNLLGQQLKNEGYNILFASSGESALELAKTHPVGVIISDQSMPGMDGVEFLSKVRQIDDEVVLIMLTGNGTLGNAVEAINELKIFSYIMKPWSADVMRSTIRNAFKHYEMAAIYKVTMKRTYQLNEKLNKENTKLTEHIRELETKLDKLLAMKS
jgi:DNA-binding NtrC family response regulator